MGFFSLKVTSWINFDVAESCTGNRNYLVESKFKLDAFIVFSMQLLQQPWHANLNFGQTQKHLSKQNEKGTSYKTDLMISHTNCCNKMLNLLIAINEFSK